MLQIQPEYYNGKTYRGAEPKAGVTINGADYILKRQRHNWNNVLCEYVASRFIKGCSIACQDVLLAQENSNLVILCRDFTNELGKLYEFGSISSSFDTDVSKHDYYIQDVFYLLSTLEFVDMDDCVEGFWKMYVMDAILGNPDRHLGNWGLVKLDGVYKFAPIYDNGASLFPRAEISEFTADWMRERIYTFPNSKIMFTQRARSSYLEVLNSDIVPRTVMYWAKSLKVAEATEFAVSGLPDKIKQFYRTIIFYRYNTIVQGKEFVWKGMLT